MTIPGLIFSAELDGLGGARFDNATTIPQQKGEIRWLHLDYTASGVHDLLEKDLGLDTYLIEALTAEGSRPRFFVQEN